MPEIKNTFVKSKMDKDLDSRLLPKGIYREGVNISVSTSEGDDVGSLENIPGNIKLTDFGLSNANLEIIGYVEDPVSDNIFVFITNYSDTSTNELDQFSPETDQTGCIIENKTMNITQNFTGGTPGVYNNANFTGGSGSGAEFRVVVSGSGEVSNVTQTDDVNSVNGYDVGDVITFTNPQFGTPTGGPCQITIREEDLHGSYGPAHYIARYNVETKGFQLLVKGNFLNFSKTHPIEANILEDLLFFTDNRNQPRKININTAIQNPLTYYTSEDNISVAKFAPIETVKFYNDTTGEYKSTMKNTVDEYLPVFFTAPASIRTSTVTTDQNLFFTTTLNLPYDNLTDHIAATAVLPAKKFKLQNLTNDDGETYYVYEIVSGQEMKVSDSNNTPITPVLPDSWENGDVFGVSIENPDYDSTTPDNQRYLEDKFIKFSYRFKYEDDEYSLMAPFSQSAFVPKQYGSFIYNQDEETKESGIVKFMENQINKVDLNIDMPFDLDDIVDKLKIKEIQILSKASDEPNVKVIAELNRGQFERGPVQSIVGASLIGGSGYNGGTSGTFSSVELTSDTGFNATFDITVTSGVVSSVAYGGGGTAKGQGYKPNDVLVIPPLGGSGSGASIRVGSITNELIYSYGSQEPIKTLPERDLLRVSDLVPVRAKTQEIIGNRVVYGNFLQNSQTLNTLDYTLAISDKVNFTGNPRTTLPQTRREYYNHTVKQGRTYQVGIVLYDRYGRSSNVILNTNNTDPSVFNSTIFAPYTNGGVSPLSWPGNSLKFILNEKIQEDKLGDYLGVYSSDNPLGWYSYRIVIKQQEQEYYNVYIPGGVSGEIDFVVEEDSSHPGEIGVVDLQYFSTAKTFNIPLFNDNINKVPRDLNEVGPTDELYSSSSVLYSRVYQPTNAYNASAASQYPIVSRQNLQADKNEVTSIKPFSDLGEWTTYKGRQFDGTFHSSIVDEDKYPYPGKVGNVDPFFLNTNSNPLIGTLSTVKRLGYPANVDGATQYSQDNTAATDILDYSFAKKLMVWETKPFRSNLDIYYETSTSGLISELNTLVDGTLPAGIPADIDQFDFRFSEGDSLNSNVSNDFRVVDSSNNVITDPLIQVSIDEMTDASGTIINSNDYPFDVDVTPGIAPSTPPIFRLKSKKELVYNSQSNIENSYNIKLRLQNSNNDFAIIQKQNLRLSNEAPSISKTNTKVLSVGYDTVSTPGVVIKSLTCKPYNDGTNDVPSLITRGDFNDTFVGEDQTVVGFTLPSSFIINNTDLPLFPGDSLAGLKSFENGTASTSESLFTEGVIFFFRHERQQVKVDVNLPTTDPNFVVERGNISNTSSGFSLNRQVGPYSSFIYPSIIYTGDRISRNDISWGGLNSGTIKDAREVTFNIIIRDASGQASYFDSDNLSIKYYIYNTTF
jgi:hypothetical protein